MELKFSKRKQLGKTGKIKNEGKTIKVSEDALQKQFNDTLKAHHIKYLRIPDWFWSGMKSLYSYYKLKNPISWQSKFIGHVLKYFAEMFGGMPDNIIIGRVSENVNLCFMVELKTKKGKLHGKQNHWYRDFEVLISRTPDRNIEIVEEFESIRKRLIDLIEAYSKNQKQ